MSTPAMSRRGLLGLLRRREDAAAPRAPEPGPVREPEPGEPPPGATAEPVEALPPWVARERARAVARETPRVARIVPFACIAASGCSVCSERCPEPGAIVLSSGRPVVEPSRCTGCGACHEACPAPLRAVQLLPVLPVRP